MKQKNSWSLENIIARVYKKLYNTNLCMKKMLLLNIL